MNAVLADILTSQRVSDGSQSFPLRHPDFSDLPVAVDPAEGAWPQRIVVRHALTYPAYRVYGTECEDAVRPSVLGRMRRALIRVPAISRILRPDFRYKDWDLGILGSCVAIQKAADDHRSSGWDRSF